ncbi:hypothetical protein PIIN_01245 [Serendipita indica DSM 11827]|uniref:F-box domain-containing protein n=1 Tax=Serendipita indica (strain DSM 11827) TaxID=1109443 RepID=G4T7V3_SERID|nr:hypothetical protein PIIN_01245 [Serendipita indica DSM 11827]
MANTSIQTLPHELLVSIFNLIDSQSLVCLCLLCRVCNEAATPILYKYVSWDLSKQGASWNIKDNFWAVFKRSSYEGAATILFKSVSWNLIKREASSNTKNPPWSAVERLPWLRNHIQSLAICLDTDSPTNNISDLEVARDWTKRHSRVLSGLAQQIDRLPSLRRLELLKRHWGDTEVFKIQVGWFSQLVRDLGARIREISLPEISYYIKDSFQFPSYLRSLTISGSAYLREYRGLNSLFASLRSLRLGECEVTALLDAISLSRQLESLEVTISGCERFSHWAKQKGLNLPVLRYIRVCIIGGDSDSYIVQLVYEFLKCITSTSRRLLSVSIDADVHHDSWTPSGILAIWIALRHGHSIKTLYLGRIPLREYRIHEVLSRCPRLEHIGFTQPWRDDHAIPYASLRSALRLRGICLTVVKPYSVQQVHAALLQHFPHISHFLLRNRDASAPEYKLWTSVVGFPTQLWSKSMIATFPVDLVPVPLVA